MKEKVVTCRRCLGKGVCFDAAWNRCPECTGRGWVTEPLTRADWLRDMTDEEMAQRILKLSQSRVNNDDGHLYKLWCDDCGACKDRPENTGECCTELEQIDCILRFLRTPVTEKETTPLGV